MSLIQRENDRFELAETNRNDGNPQKEYNDDEQLFSLDELYTNTNAGFYGVLSGRFTSHFISSFALFSSSRQMAGFFTSYPHAKLTDMRRANSDELTVESINNFGCRIWGDGRTEVNCPSPTALSNVMSL